MFCGSVWLFGGDGRESHYHCPFGCEAIRSQQDRARARKPDQEAQVKEEFGDVAAGEPGISEEPLPAGSSQRQSSSSEIPASGIPIRRPAGEREEQEQDTEAPHFFVRSWKPPHCLWHKSAGQGAEGSKERG